MATVTAVVINASDVLNSANYGVDKVLNVSNEQLKKLFCKSYM
jgi:hypothetical protein